MVGLACALLEHVFHDFAKLYCTCSLSLTLVAEELSVQNYLQEGSNWILGGVCLATVWLIRGLTF